MVGGSYLVPYSIRSSSSLLFRPLLACYQNPTSVSIYHLCLYKGFNICLEKCGLQRRRSIQTGRDKHGERVFGSERAASTAEEFLKIAEEKAEQGIKSEGAGKNSDNLVKKATIGDTSGGDIYADKERLKPGVEDESFRNTPK